MKPFILNFAFILLINLAQANDKIDVKDFEAKGDGKTNDAKAFQGYRG